MMPFSKPKRNKFRKKTDSNAIKPGAKAINARQSGQIRIIAGKHKGRKLPVRMVEGLRPTGDRTKETLFNWLMHDIVDARVLDLFAGAGSLGFEAYSRGAKSVLMVEMDKANAKQLEENRLQLQTGSSVEVHCDDALLFCKKLSAEVSESPPFDIVFIDPPFSKHLALKAITQLFDNRLLQHGSLVYLETEHGISLDATLASKLSLLREKATQQASIRLFRVK
uniref:16S rRNA (guanine(966)-N(2))-methyltransferase RsmD n=1 Tax=Ningiella ruwaisensis TaxID=2364274 RepID=UPI0019D68914|nr:16S rRNA (guanine(966)-N(2))-methyltransferase RsmD [Ningiella ruwaisensis]